MNQESLAHKRWECQIKYVLTHAEYNKNKWKNDPYY